MKLFGLTAKRKLLSEQQEALLTQERAAFEGLQMALQSFGADVSPADTHTLDESIAHLGELFLLVIAGEFNSGKSSFINALLGDKVVAEGVTPTTDRITLLRYGATATETPLGDFMVERQFPADALQRMVLVDTPGANAIIRRHEELTREFIPRADLVLFVTSADRPFTESERGFLEVIREWGKKVVIVLNKVDLLEDDERLQVEQFIRENVTRLFGFTPEILAVSARTAQRARISGDEAEWKRSRFDEVERYIFETLDEEERIRLKLSSPLGVAQRLCDKYLQVVEGRMELIQQDVATIENIERQLDLFRDDIANDFHYHETEVANILADFELRGLQFFDDTIKVTNIPRMVRDSDGIRAQFEQEVVAEVPQQIETRTQALIDWMIEKNLRLWQSIMEYLRREKVPQHRDGLIGDVGGSFEYNRSALIDSVAHSAQAVVETYDRETESRALAEEVRGAIAGSALVGIGAVGLGALLVALLHTAALDFTGILAAGVLAIGGLYLIPNKRRQVKKQFRERIADLRSKLQSTIQRAFENELAQMLVRIRDAIAPYTRFIRSQREQLVNVQRKLSDVDVELERLRDAIER
ncbi:MAG: dynamin family protein [Roseiflexaceae bacterium]|nr:dynamin family protein [Roseiflexaceae bacterium]